MQTEPTRAATTDAEHGGILSSMLGLLLLAVIAGGVWWWFFGRFALPSEEPARPTEVVGVIDYVGRRDLGTDPYKDFDDVERPDPKLGRDGGVPDANYVRWAAEFGKALTARAAWKVLDQGGALTDALQDKAREAHRTYLHHAQLAEYYRAKYRAASDE